MKMYYGNVPIQSMNIRHYEMDTNDCDMVASDLQAGKTAVARGKRITGTGKCFEFASYGALQTNSSRYVPTNINVVEISSTVYPIKLNISLDTMYEMDFTSPKQIAIVNIDGVNYPLNVSVVNNILKITCEKTFYLEVFYGKDNYV